MENGSTLGLCCTSICNYHQLWGELLDRVGGRIDQFLPKFYCTNDIHITGSMSRVSHFMRNIGGGGRDVSTLT